MLIWIQLWFVASTSGPGFVPANRLFFSAAGTIAADPRGGAELEIIPDPKYRKLKAIIDMPLALHKYNVDKCVPCSTILIFRFDAKVCVAW